MYPTGAETQAYIESYATAFGLNECLVLNTAVTALEKRADGKPGWTFKVAPAAGGAPREELFDFAVVCSGMYSAPPNMPAALVGEAAAGYTGRVMHSSEFLDRAVAAGKKVIVVGGGKSAVDITVDSAKVSAAPPTMLFRAAHWSTPRKILGFIPFQYIFLSRFGQALVSFFKGGYPSGAPTCVRCSYYVLWPVMWVAFKVVASKLRASLSPFLREEKNISSLSRVVILEAFEWCALPDHRRSCPRASLSVLSRKFISPPRVVLLG